MSKKINDFISNNWDSCIKANREDVDTLLGLPYPYTVPAVGHFDEMYYWDTYFTNVGLIISDRAQQAKFNVDNMLYLVNKYGFMPNGNRTFYLTRSQPPFLSLMVRDVYEYYKDPVWLKSSYEILIKEYEFWMSRRNTPIGLNQYACESTDKNLLESFAGGFRGRTGVKTDEDVYDLGRHCMINCESGWDINPRWGYRGYEYAHLDLNCLMYAFEENMSYFCKELGINEKEWEAKANDRKAKMEKYMLNENNIFLDYDFKNDKLSDVFSAASIYPLFVKLADKEQAKALVDNLAPINAQYGILTCENKNNVERYQWDYPNGWACLQYVAIKGFQNYGYNDLAKEIATKYVKLVDKVFEDNNNLWEKYNVVDGSINVSNEYDMPAMMGWTAGAYLYASKLIEE